jgi:hypothetical protein
LNQQEIRPHGAASVVVVTSTWGITNTGGAEGDCFIALEQIAGRASHCDGASTLIQTAEDIADPANGLDKFCVTANGEV